MSKPIPPMPYSHPTSDTEVVRATVAYIALHDERFQGDTRKAKRLRRRAEKNATKVLSWWHKEGQNAYASAADAPGSGTIATILIAIFGQWIAGFLADWVMELVKTLLVNWLTSQQAGRFRAASMSRRAA